jgi:hypothetical protein
LAQKSREAPCQARFTMSGDVARFERELLDDPALRAAALAQCEAEERAAALRSVEEFVVGYVVLPAAARLVIALWAIATWLAEIFDAFPYLCFSSPLPRCGKTRAIEILELLVRHPWRGTTPSEAALFRFLATAPTLLLDEVEGLSLKNRSDRDQAIVSILNSGYRRGATVIRCNGQSHEVEKFHVYGPKALCVVGPLPPALADRSIMIPMQRRKSGETLRRFRFSRAEAEADSIRSDIEKQANACGKEVSAVYADLPAMDFLGDRDEEIFAPLFAVCAVFAPARLAELEHCAKTLCGAKARDNENDSLALRLLADIGRLWPKGQENWLSDEMVRVLMTESESPWGGDIEMSQRRLARMVRPFGLRSRQVRTPTGAGKGYTRTEFEAASSPYLCFGSETGETTCMDTGGE